MANGNWFRVILMAGVMAWGSAVVTDAQTLIAADELWPGTSIRDGSYAAWVPEGVPVLRFAIFRHQCGLEPTHDLTSFGLAARCMYVFLYAYDAGDIDAFLRKVAAQTGHPEIPNLPIMSDGECNPIDVAWVTSAFADRLIAHYSWFGTSHYPKVSVTHVQQDGKGETMSFGGSGNSPYVYVPKWGWPHGYYGANCNLWPLYAKLTEMRVPAGTDLTKGKAQLKDIQIPSGKEWRGKSWRSEWPEIFARADYPGDPGGGVWLPDREYAYLWQSRVCRHPTKTQIDQGEEKFGVLSNATMVGPPGIWVTSPSRHYHPLKSGAKNFPLYAKGTSISVTVGRCDTEYDVDSMYLYEGDRLVGQSKSNAYRTYVFRDVRLDIPGMRWLTVHTKLKGGRMVASRPAMLYVTDLVAPVRAATGLPGVYRVRSARDDGSVRVVVADGRVTPQLSRKLPLVDLVGRALPAAASALGPGVRIVPLR